MLFIGGGVSRGSERRAVGVPGQRGAAIIQWAGPLLRIGAPWVLLSSPHAQSKVGQVGPGPELSLGP